MLELRPYPLVLVAGAVIAVALGVASWRRRASTPAASALAFAMLGIAIWEGTEGIGGLFADEQVQRGWFLAGTPGLSIVVAGFFWECRMLVDRHAVPTRRGLLLLAIEPVLAVIASATNGLHGGILAGLRDSAVPGAPAIMPGPLYWAHNTYCWGLALWALVGVARNWSVSSNLQRGQLRTVVLAAAIPMVAGMPLIFSLNGNVGSIDFSAIALLPTGLLTWWALFRQGLMRLVPVARTVVLERLSDAVLVLDLNGVILDLNPSAERLCRLIVQEPPPELIGRSLPALMGTNQLISELPQTSEHAVVLSRGGVDLDVRNSQLTDRRGTLIGYGIVARDITELTEQKRRLAEVNERLTRQLVTIERLRADYAEQAARDSLTGLHNRRHLMRTMDEEMRTAQANGGRLAAVLLDIDRFKAVNDTAGHAVGDELLAATAHTLAEGARAGDTVARYGGEEFVVLLPGATMEQAWTRAEDWRRRCAAVMVPSALGPVSATISAGVATYPECGTTVAALLEAADGAMYAAKAAGRDRVLLARPAA